MLFSNKKAFSKKLFVNIIFRVAARRKYILSGPTRGGGIVAMKAMLLENFGQPLKYRDVPDPAPGYGEVVLDVEACGVCHSDLKIVSGLR